MDRPGGVTSGDVQDAVFPGLSPEAGNSPAHGAGTTPGCSATATATAAAAAAIKQQCTAATAGSQEDNAASPS